MVDYEVENTLREIRERVVAESAQASAVAPRLPNASADSAADASAPARGGAGTEALARLQANLATTERAWSRLPPVLSYRRGITARAELWLKRQIKRAAHWFTWEQVNFNSAAHHALADAREALAAHERALEEMRADLRRQRSETESSAAQISELQERLDGAFAQIASGAEQLAAVQRASAEQLRAEQRAGLEQLRVEHREQVRALASGLRDEARASAEHALEEQRVCFKQLSLEAAESAVTQDRARRQIEARIEALEAKD